MFAYYMHIDLSTTLYLKQTKNFYFSELLKTKLNYSAFVLYAVLRR